MSEEIKNFKKPSVFALIPAKLNSRRLPQKNIKELGGIPLYEFSVRVAQNCRLIDKAYVSSESSQLLNMARGLGCEVIHRPEALSQDHVTNKDVLLHAVKCIEEDYQGEVDYLVLLQPTHPFRFSDEIELAIDIMVRQPHIDTLITVIPNDALRGKIEDGHFIPEFSLPRERKDEPELYQVTGSFYIFNVRSTLKKSKMYSDWTYPYLLKRPEFEIDIDEPFDFELAKALFAANRNEFGFLKEDGE